jgi:hypothetical protein
VKPIIPFAALACALIAAPAAAQDDAPRATSISLDLGSGAAIGVWRDVSPRVRAGVEVGTSLTRLEGEDGGNDDYTTFFVEPALKIFSATGGDLRPYTLVGVYAQQYGQRQSSSDPDWESEWYRREVGARLGLGLEWSPASRVGIGGHVGVSGGYLKSSNETTLGEDTRADGWAFSTLNSGVVVHLFF